MNAAQYKEINDKLDNLQQTDQERGISKHPVIFVLLLILFFITMNFWAITAHEVLKKIRGTDTMAWYEYLIIASISLTVLIIFTDKAGLQVGVYG